MTELIRTRDELRRARARRSGPGGPVVLVPTMGALHHGHRQLLRTGRAAAGAEGTVVISIFVNPLQFGPGEDLERYPRTLGADLAAAREEGADLAFAPSAAEMYPGGEPSVTIDPGPAGRRFEGEFRPGFFAGVLTVVAKLFALTRPDIAVFGEKDAQQLALIRAMVTDLDLGVRIEPVPVVRDPDGLATSSRNRYLSDRDRERALVISRALTAGAAAAASGPAEVLARARTVLDAEPGLSVDYLALADPGTFGPVTAGPAVLATAARTGGTRLIDNVRLTLPEAVTRGQARPVTPREGHHGAARH